MSLVFINLKQKKRFQNLQLLTFVKIKLNSQQTPIPYENFYR